MLEKTKGIVLQSIKYSDSGIIVHLYTEKFGRQSALIRGLRNKKSGKHGNAFQPLFILDLEMYYKPSREIQLLKEFSLTHPFYNISSDIRKSTAAMFLSEVLSSVLGEETSNPGMFSYIENSIIWFEGAEDDFINFHISFLIGLCRYLGIEPGRKKNADEMFFDLRNGRFLSIPPLHGDYADENTSAIIWQFMNSSVSGSGSISLSGKTRNETLETLIKYFSFHLPSLRNIRSLDVLREVFS
ncbi:MAG TPA: DNA repair protein RecO [Bacteroidales bacterium]|nr:DNA repair protein RecO [Bacteroidales bacterium]